MTLNKFEEHNITLFTGHFSNVCLASVADDIPDTVANATPRVALVLAGAAEAGPHVAGFVPAQTVNGEW